jgi:DNA-binding XRE family transcriptional regulator
MNETREYTSIDEWLAANPLFVWRTAGDETKPMEYAAQQCGASRTSVMYWERGEFMPKHKYMQAIATMMRVDFGMLYTQWQSWLDGKPATQPAQAVA